MYNIVVRHINSEVDPPVLLVPSRRSVILKVTLRGVEMFLRLKKSKIFYNDYKAELISSNYLVFSSVASIYAIRYAIQARDHLSRLLVRDFPNMDNNSVYSFLSILLPLFSLTDILLFITTNLLLFLTLSSE